MENPNPKTDESQKEACNVPPTNPTDWGEDMMPPSKPDFIEEMENPKLDLEGIPSIPQFDDNIKLLRVDYSKNSIELMDKFRGILKTGEISERVYNLTTKVISKFPTNYVAWVVRRQCLDKVKELDLNKELLWLDYMMVVNQKNYQIWHHRKLLIDRLNDASHEKKVLNEIFIDEHKNFHAWSHRIWMIRRFNNIEGELEFIEEMFKHDIKNNSAWNYRFFLIQFMNNNKITKEIIESEIKYAIEKINKEPKNECPYCYIRGFVNKFKYKFSDFGIIKEEMEKIANSPEKNNSYCMNLLLDIYEEEKDENKFNGIIEALISCDYIRKKYYSWRKINYNK